MKTLQINLTGNQLGFLKHLLQNAELRGSEAPLFLELVEAIRRAEQGGNDPNVRVEEDRPNH